MQWRELDSRPRGITIAGILFITGGIGAIVQGIAYLVIGSNNLSAVPGYNTPNVVLLLNRPDTHALLLNVFFGSMAAIIGLGLLYLYVSYALLNGKGWARKFTIVIMILGFLGSIFSAFTQSG